jgi:hypothetical protein
MKKETIFNIGVTLIALAGVGLAVKTIYFPRKEKLVNRLLEFDSDRGYDVLISFGYGYLWKRLQAFKRGKETYFYDGKIYDTKTGLAK